MSYQELNKKRRDANKYNAYWNYLDLGDLLNKSNFVEQSIACYITSYNKSKNNFTLNLINKYISNPNIFINITNKKIETKNDLKVIIHNLWGGYSFETSIWLELIFLNKDINEDIKFEIAWNLSRWYHYKKEFYKIIDKLEYIEEYFYNTFNERKEYILIKFYYLIDTNQKEKALKYIKVQIEKEPDNSDFILALVSIEKNEELKLSLINNIFKKNKLFEIRKINSNEKLSLKNIRTNLLSKNNTNQLVSIIIPVYNAEDTIEIAINSLLNQTWTNTEIIIVDDCSTDSTKSIIDRLAIKHSKIKFLNQEKNHGAYAARNLGLSIAKGYYITTHDADDWSHPQKIETQINFLNKTSNLKAVCTHWIRTSFNLNFIYNWRVGKELIHWSHSSLLFKKEIIKDIGLWDDVRVGADTEFIWRIQKKYGVESVNKIYPEIPFSFALDDSTNLTRTKATHIQSMYYGLRYIYRENAKNWHENSKELRLEKSSRSFNVPCILKNKEDYKQEFDKIYISDFTDNLSTKIIKNSILNYSKAGLNVGIFHWPNFGSSEDLNKEYFKISSVENMKSIVSGYQIKTEELIFIDKNHQLIIPDYFPSIETKNIKYFSISSKLNKTKDEVFFKLKEAFKTDYCHIESFRIKQLYISKDHNEIFLNNKIKVIKDNIVNINISLAQKIYKLSLNCKLPSLNFFDENAINYLDKYLYLDNYNFYALNLTYSLISIHEKAHDNAKISRNILLHLSENDTFLLYKFIVSVPEEILPFISKFYFLLLLKKKPEDNFLQYLTLKLSEFTKDNFSELIDIHSITDLVNRGAFQKNNFQLTFETTKIVNKYSEKILQSIITNIYRKNFIKKEISLKKIVFILSRPFFDNIKSNSHFIVLDIYSKLINNYNKINPKNQIEKNVLITSERSFNLTHSDLFIPKKSDLEINLNLFIENGIIENKSNFYFNSDRKKFNSLSYSNQQLSILKPDLLVFLGGTFDSKIFRYITFNKYPISFLPTTSSLDNAYGKPDYYFDTTKAATINHKDEFIKWGIDKNKIFYFPKPFFIDKQLLSTKKFNWNNYKLSQPKGKFVLTPLTGNRINKWLAEMSEDEINAYLDLFFDINDLIWIFVGQSFQSLKKLAINKNKRILKLIKNKRIIIIDFTTELNELIREIDIIYFPSNGGATTIANSIFYEKPCIIPIESDANTLVSSYSLYNNLIEAFSKIKEILNNNDIRNKIIIDSKDSLNTRSDIDSISRNFIHQLEKAIKFYKER